MKRVCVALVLMLSFYESVHAASISLAGVVRSENQKSITSRYMGFVNDVYVEEGSVVKKGDVLYTIDSKEIDTAKAQAQLAIAQAELNEQMYTHQYKNALLNLERHQRLLAKDMVSKFDVETFEVSVSNLKAMKSIAQKQRLQAKQKLEEVQHYYRYLNVRAPNDGAVIEKQIKVGEMALPGVSSLILSDLSSLKIVIDVSESQLSTMRVGEDVEVRIASISYSAQGRIAAIVPALDAQSHTFKVKIAFESTARVYPGMYAEVVFKGEHL